MKRLTYMSSFSRPLSREEIAELGAYSAQRNATEGITGVLLTLGGAFFQIMEGEQGVVDDLYARVLRDDRHTDLVCLRAEPGATSRLFPDWSMNTIDLEQIEGDVVEPLKLLLARMSDAQHIIERYTQPAVSRLMLGGLNPLEVPVEKVERLVLFTDMVGFSAITARLSLDELSEVVAVYLEICSTGVARCGGEVTKYLGDGLMAYFDAADVDPALESCVDIQRELKRVRDMAPATSALSVLFSGFGLAMGPVIEGSMGSSVKMDYTIIGEPVNTAARLEALTRKLGTTVLMSEPVAAAADDRWEISPRGMFDLEGGSSSPVHSLETGATDMAAAQATIARALGGDTP